MNLVDVIGFGLKVGHLLLLLCCWFLSLIPFNWVSNEGIMSSSGGGSSSSSSSSSSSTKVGFADDGGQHAWMEFWDRIHQHYSQCFGSRKVRKDWWKMLLIAWIVFGIMTSSSFFWYMRSQALEKRKETLGSMCDERARMLQDQFNVSMNHIQAMSVMISIFHHGKTPSAIDQRTFAKYTESTSFERPLTSGVAYAVRVLHAEREQFEIQHGLTIKRMDSVEQNPVHKDEYDPADLEPSPVQEEYAPVIFAQDTVAHVISVDMLSGKEDRDNVLRARESGKGVLTAPFRLLKTNRLGVILTFAVYKTELSPDATTAERIRATAGYLGGIFDIESLVEKLLQQLASKQTILVNVYDTTNISDPISMYGSSDSFDGLHHVSALNFGDPFRKHEMYCRFKRKPPWPWVAITTSVGILIISLLVGQIFHATMNRIAKVEDDYLKMEELQKRAVAADVAKSEFLATVSHEIRTPMNGVLGMLQMLMDTGLDETQKDYVRTARESGKALVSLINEVLDLAKIESGKLELEAVVFDLRNILDDVLSLFSGKSQDKKLELAVYVSSKVPATLVGDPGRFRQIVTNLVGNSIKFTDKGHIFVTVHLVEEVLEEMEVERCSLSGLPVVDRRRSWAGFKSLNKESATGTSSSLPSSADQINIIVSVEDTGQGIPVEAQSRVFNPFMQVGPSITRNGGTGIGLSISKCLVQLMKGEIGVASSPKIGSTFTFTAVFTNACSNLSTQEQVSRVSSSEFEGMRAVVVDSNPVRAMVSKYHIQRLGIHIKVVADLSQVFSGSGCGTKPPLNIVFMEESIWNEVDARTSVSFLNSLTAESPKVLVVSNSTSCVTLSSSDVPDPIVVRKPLRASMLAVSLQRAMGERGYRNGEHHKLSSLSSSLNGKRILVVDDNPVNLMVAAGALKKYGAQVVHAERGRDAVLLLTPPHQFDACFMDIQMPEMDGFEATEQIREIESHENKKIQGGQMWHVPILAMTADVIHATYEECFRNGMDGYVSKPFEAEILYREVLRIFQTVHSADDD